MKKSIKTMNTILFFLLYICIILMIDSRVLNQSNIPVLFFMFPWIFFYKRIKIDIGLKTKKILYYGIYLLIITIIFFHSNYDQNNAVFSLIEYGCIFGGIYLWISKIQMNIFWEYFKNAGVIISILCIVEAIIQKPFVGELLGKHIYIDSDGYRVAAIFSHPIVCGLFLVIFWIITVYFPYNSRMKNIIVQFIEITAIAFTKSRSAWLGLGCSLFLVIIVSLKNSGTKVDRKYFMYVLLLILLFSVINISLNLNIIESVYTYISSRIAGSLYAGAGQGNIIRIDTMYNSIQYWREGHFVKFLFGSGKNYDKIFMKMFPVIKWGKAWTETIDNQYFTIIHETGIIGLILILYIIFKSLKDIFSYSNNRECVFSCISIIAIAVCIFFFEGFNYMEVVSLIILLVMYNDKITEEIKKNEY